MRLTDDYQYKSKEEEEKEEKQQQTSKKPDKQEPLKNLKNQQKIMRVNLMTGLIKKKKA